jgi:single-stranded DNA-binding protein
MNNFSAVARLGMDPESIQLGDREGRKLRLVEEAPGKKSIARWFNAIVTGKDVEIADRLEKGDQIFITGQLALTEYSPKKTKYKGEKVKSDEMPFAKILQVLKSEKFFGGGDAEGSEAEQAAEGTESDTTDGVTATEDPLAGV